MKVTWSMQMLRKKRVNSASASSLKLPRPSRSLRRGWSQAARCCLYSHVAGEAARDRPDRAGVEEIEQNRVRHQPRDAAVAVEERVNPQQAVMRRRRREDRVGPAEAAIDFLEALQEAGQGAGADRRDAADLDIAAAQFARHHRDLLFRLRVFDEEQIVREKFAETAVGFADAVGGDGAVLEPALVDPALDGDMGVGLKLEVALLRVAAIVVFEGALDIDRVRIVALDQVRVVAVHRPHEGCERGEEARGKAAAEASRFLAEVEGEVGEPGAVARGLRKIKRLHQRDQFAPVRRSGRILGRFCVPILLFHISNNNSYL